MIAIGHNSLTRAEAEILRLWDGGWSRQRIARERPDLTGKIAQTISLYGEHPNREQSRFAQKAIEGSRRLAEAVAATGRSFR